MARAVKLIVDGRDVEVQAGTMIIEAARKTGVEIPTFCYDQRLKSVGACRMCLVEVEKSPKLVASCSTPVAEGMVVRTDSEKVVKARKGVLEFLLVNHPLDCPTCDKGGECGLQDLTLRYGPDASRYAENKIRFQDDPKQNFDDLRLGPEIWLNRNRCIICFKCVRIVRDLAGWADLGIFHRGAFAKVDTPSDLRYTNDFSGNTVEYCPVGALTADSFRYKVRPWLLTRTPSVSWLCPDGSNITVEHYQGKIYRHSSRRNEDVDNGFLPDKDRFGFDIVSHPDRLRQPLADQGGSHVRISYDEAVARLVHRLSEETGQSSALLLDTTLTNEEAYCASEFVQKQLPGAAIALSSEYLIGGNIPATSLGLSVTMPELEQADLILLAGCDLAAEHPVIGLRVRSLIAKGVPVYYISHRRIYLGAFELSHIPSAFGREYAIIDGLVTQASRSDRNKLPLDIRNQFVADADKAKNIHILAGGEALSGPNARLFLRSLQRLANLTSGRMSVLTTETNYLGVRLTGNPDATMDDILMAIEAGKIRTLLVAGGDPVNVYPDRKRVVEAFKKLDYLIYWGAFINGTSKLASLLIPGLLPVETDGSYLNIERRLQFLSRPYPCTRGIVALIQLLTDLKSELGGEEYYSAAEVFAEMSAKIPQFGGLRYRVSEGHLVPCSGFNVGGNVVAPAEIEPPPEYPYMLTFARSLYYGASGITAKSKTLERLTPPQCLLVNEGDARRLGLKEGMHVRLDTAWASAMLTVSMTGDVSAGHLVLHGCSDDVPPNKFMAGYNRPVYARIVRSVGSFGA